MASTVPFVRDYAYIIVRLKFTEDIKSLAPSSLFCHYGDTNDAFPIGGLVDIGETPIAAVLRYLRELAGIRLARHFPMFLCNIIAGYKEHETIKIHVFVTDILWDELKYRNNYHALTLGNEIKDNKAEREELENQQEHNGDIAPFVVPNSMQCPIIHDISIIVHHWDSNENKAHCFDYCEIYTAFQIKGNLGADAGIIPLFHDKNVMRDFSDENGLWAAVLTVLKTRVPAKDLDMNRHLLESTDTVNMSRFLQKLEHCNGEDSTKLHNHLKQSILKIKGFGINPDSKQGVVVLVSSFT